MRLRAARRLLAPRRRCQPVHCWQGIVAVKTGFRQARSTLLPTVYQAHERLAERVALPIQPDPERTTEWAAFEHLKSHTRPYAEVSQVTESLAVAVVDPLDAEPRTRRHHVQPRAPDLVMQPFR